MSTPATEHHAPAVVAAAASGRGPSRLLVLRQLPALVLGAFAASLLLAHARWAAPLPALVVLVAALALRAGSEFRARHGTRRRNTMSIQPDPNFPTGTTGLVAVDKVGNQVLFLDPRTYATVEVLQGFLPRVHELAISPDHARAYAPIYGDGRHGDNPHPGQQVAEIDLAQRRHIGYLDVAPYCAPHGLRWGSGDALYCVCENSGVVLELDPRTGEHRAVIDVGSSNAHRIEVLSDGSKLYTENEEDATATVVDLAQRRPVAEVKAPHALAGLALSPDGTTIVLVDGEVPEIHLLDTATDTIRHTIPLEGHQHAAQIARFSPDGRRLVVTSLDGNLATVISGDFTGQRTVPVGRDPMDMAFAPDGRTAVIGNQGDGTLSVLDLDRGVVDRTVDAGAGVESLAFY